MIPLARPLHFGLRGRDVWAVQRALKHAGFRDAAPTSYYGHNTATQVHKFQNAVGIDNEHIYGYKTHKHLWPEFDQYARLRYKQAYDALHQETIADKVVRIALYAYSMRDYMHYTQDGRRMTDFDPPPNVPNYTDCSGFATWDYKSAGAPDPNGFGYNGYGYTGTMLLHGTYLTFTNLKRGCLIFYGRPVVTHVAIYIGNGRVVSFGSESGPYVLSWNYRSDANQARSYF